MHWLALHLPFLSLEVLSRGLGQRLPLAMAERDRSGLRVFLCNAEAARRGIAPGMSGSAARALAADLRLIERDLQRESRALEVLAAWAGRFSSQVSLYPPQGLLLEAGRSLRLFRGGEPLLEAVRQGLEGLGYRGRLCLAPTPEGAMRLACAGTEGVIESRQRLEQALAPLPLDALGLAPEVLGPLSRMGIGRVATLLGLPRPGLARRFGAGWVQWLERLLGETPDPRLLFEPPARYRGRLELPAEVQDAQGLLFGIRRLLRELSGFLIGRQAAALRLDWALLHAGLPSTRFSLELLEPQSESEPMLELVRERLERVELPAPVREILLGVDRPAALEGHTGDLFSRAAGSARLLERLRARLGDERVRGLLLLADALPERAWREVAPGEGGEAGEGGGPLWLLPQPEPLELRDGRPWHHGRLEIGPEPHRIESGWWHGADQARDYYIARTPTGERLWIYRERRAPGRWLLHGIFG